MAIYKGSTKLAGGATGILLLTGTELWIPVLAKYDGIGCTTEVGWNRADFLL